MQGASEIIARQLNRLGIHIALKPASSLRTTSSRIKDFIPKDQQSKQFIANYSYVYVRRLSTRINEHKLAVRRPDPLSLVFAHVLECDYRFNWDKTEVVAMANTKRAKEFFEAWYFCVVRINRHVDLDVHYKGLSSRLATPVQIPHQQPAIQRPGVRLIRHQSSHCSTEGSSCSASPSA
ncbi:unnamed protein product [Schistocephalus solidus]|uniref:Uncharacterized protein n=1 Tax=Schistocephalus solidus TaxID=70667 RepID=A0A183SXY6_SCHSO|nr:unnamed protein product [Schistocephalus solidus]